NLNSLRPQVEQLSFSVGDFIPVARINYSPWVFVAKPDAPFGGTIKGMADWAKANPDKLIYSSDNVNGPTHIVFLLMEQKTGAKMWPLQLGGGGPAIANLLDSNTIGLCRRSERGRRAHSRREAQGPLRDRHAALGKPAECPDLPWGRHRHRVPLLARRARSQRHAR